MAKRIRFIRLEVENFAGLREKAVEYGDITKLTGKNGQGKTSIGTAPPWIFFGTDLFGKTYSPAPTNYDYDVVRARLTLDADGEEITFERQIDRGDTVYIIDGTPKSATKFKEAVAELFTKEDFLSLYNPSFFFTQHWTKQREQIMKNTIPPAKSEVLGEMSRTSPDQKLKDIPLNPAAAKLSELTKKATLDDLVEQHSGKNGLKTKLEKKHIADQSRTKTLKEQLDHLPDSVENPEEMKSESAELAEKIQKVNEQIEAANETNQRRNAVHSALAAAQKQVESAKERYMKVFNESIEDSCPACKRPLDEDAVKAVTESKEKRKEELREEHADLVKNRKELEAELAGMEAVDVSDLWNEMRELERKRDNLEGLIVAQNRRQGLKAEVDASKQAETDTLASLKETIFILDAIKAYRAKEAELQAAKVQSLFTSLRIRLFNYVKTTGEHEPFFSIQMDGKDYIALSVGEKIEAGLELTEVLFKQSELIVPTFIDGIGEYTGKVVVYDQLITGRAVPDQELKIEAEIAVR